MDVAELHSFAERKERDYQKWFFFVLHNYNRNVQAAEP